MEELRKVMNSLTKQGKEEKERAIKQESRSRRNNLNFLNIPEEKNKSFEKSEKVLQKFMEAKLKLSKLDAKGISLDAFTASGNQVPRIQSRDRSSQNLCFTNVAVARDFPKEIVDNRNFSYRF